MSEEVQANQWPHKERFLMPAALLDEPKVNVQAEPKVTNFLGTERALLERFMPGLDAELKAIPLAVLEGRENPSTRILKEAKGPGLLIPKKYGGLGVQPRHETLEESTLGAQKVGDLRF